MKLNQLSLTLLLATVVLWYSCQSDQALSAEEILQKSVAYHDPDHQWESLEHQFNIVTSYTDKPDRETMLDMDNAKNYLRFEQPAKGVEAVMQNDSCEVLQGDIDCAAVERTRNYWLYLTGLPMKLQDSGTALQTEVSTDTLRDINCYVLTVKYEQDTWHYYFNQKNFALEGYDFFFNEQPEKAEKIHLEGEVMVGNMKLSEKRVWYTFPDYTYLGTDHLKETQALSNK